MEWKWIMEEMMKEELMDGEARMNHAT